MLGKLLNILKQIKVMFLCNFCYYDENGLQMRINREEPQERRKSVSDQYDSLILETNQWGENVYIQNILTC